MVIGAVSGTAAVAIYGIAVQINHYYLNFSSSIGSFFFPRIVSMSVKDANPKELSDLFIKVGRVQLFVIALICSGFIAFGKDFILLWTGEEYLSAYYIIVVLMVPTLIGRSQSLGNQILLAKNKHKFRAVFYLGITILDILISIPLVMLFDGLGAALGTAIAQLIGPVITMNIYYSRVIGLDIKAYFKSTIPILLKVSVILMLGMTLSHFLNATSWLVLGAEIIIYLLVYLVLIYFWGFNDYEKSLVSGILRKLKR
jgi:O-antigen/teichoic acid export membrane protein